MYGKGIIARKYEKNQVIKVRVELTANHMGFFEFRLCPNNNAKKPASQMCLDKNIMRDANSGDSRLGVDLLKFYQCKFSYLEKKQVHRFEGILSLCFHILFVCLGGWDQHMA